MVSRRHGTAQRADEEQRLAFGIALRKIRSDLQITSTEVLVEPMQQWLASVGQAELAVKAGQVRNWESDGERVPRSSPVYPVQVWALEGVLGVEPASLSSLLGMEPFEAERAWSPRLPSDRPLAQVVEELEARVAALEARLPATVGRGR